VFKKPFEQKQLNQCLGIHLIVFCSKAVFATVESWILKLQMICIWDNEL